MSLVDGYSAAQVADARLLCEQQKAAREEAIWQRFQVAPPAEKERLSQDPEFTYVRVKKMMQSLREGARQLELEQRLRPCRDLFC